MSLFDVIPEDLFSVLASKNRRLYVETLEVLWDLYQDRVKISHKMYLSSLLERLEGKSDLLFFEEEEMNQEEKANIRGKASFLIRKLKQKGWFEGEHSADYELFYTVPNYSSKLLDLFHSLQENQPSRGFTYVYGTYSALKTAELEKDPSGRMHALNLAYQNTQDLLKLLKTVYHNIKRYVKQQFDLQDSNEVLAMYYDDFIKNVSEIYIRPLKVRESVPKYRDYIQSTLLGWLEEEETFSEIVDAFLSEENSTDFQQAAMELKRKIYWIHQQYDSLEEELLDEIDLQLRRYTRTATQKLKNLLNRDQNTKGNLIFLLQSLGNEGNTTAVEQIQDVFQLNTQKFYDEKSLYHRKNPSPRQMKAPVMVEEVELSAQAEEEMEALLYRPYGKWGVHAFMEELFGEKEKIYSKDFPFQEEKGYVMSFLSLLYHDDPQCFYQVEVLEGRYETPPYAVPQMVYSRKEDK